MKTLKNHFLLILLLLVTITRISLQAQNSDQIIVVPASVEDPLFPHFVHEGALFTLKAILRNTSASSYTISWDIDGDGVWDKTFNVVENSNVNGVRDIGVQTNALGVSTNTLFIATVKVRNNSTMAEQLASFPYYVYNWQPDSIPTLWTEEQILVMREMALQETLWYLHRQLSYLNGNGAANMAGHYGHANTDSQALDVFLSNGHFPAYPPGTLNDYGLTIPEGWQEKNYQRWDKDPYAETALRIMNYQLGTLSAVNIPSGSEDSTVGYNQFGAELYGQRILGTTNNKAIKTSLETSDAGIADGTAHLLAAFAKTLYALDGIPVQVGGNGIIGKPVEFIIQEMIDYLVYHQIDGGTGSGGFYYYPYEGSTNSSMGETGAGVAKGLWEAQRFFYPYGIIVNNKIKYRMADNVFYQQGSDNLVKRFGQASYGNNNFNYTGGYLGICHWLGIDYFTVSDDTVAFPGYSTKTRGQLRTAYDNYFSTATPLWNSGSKLDPFTWLDHFWPNGDYLSGNPSGVYNQILGSTFNMYSWVSGLSNCYAYLDLIGSHDWQREITIHLLRGQEKLINPSSFGQFNDGYCNYASHSCIYNPPLWSTVIAGQALSDMQNMSLPLAVGQAMPQQVEVDDTVYFDHSSSLTINKFKIINYQWDVDLSDGLWWENGNPADYTTEANDEAFRYSYDTSGTYTATLLVRDNSGHRDTATIIITVIPAKSPPGNCLAFNGDEGHVHVNNNASLQPSGPFTLEAWVYVDSTVFGSGIIDNGYFTSGSVNQCGGFSLGISNDSSERFSFRVCNGVNYPDEAITLISSSAYMKDCWNHVAAVNTGSALILYVNGIEEGKVLYTGPVNYDRVNLDPDFGLNIGCFKDDDEELVFCGMLDEVRIWGDERTPLEISDNLCSILTGNESNLLAYYRFDYNQGARAMDDLSPLNNYAFLLDMDSTSVWSDSEAFNTWQGISDNLWHNPGNWSDGIPDPDDNLGIVAAAIQPFFTEADTSRIMVVSTGAEMAIQSDALAVSDIIINNGQMTIYDTLYNNQMFSIFLNRGMLSNFGIIEIQRLFNDENGNVILHDGKIILKGEEE